MDFRPTRVCFTQRRDAVFPIYEFLSQHNSDVVSLPTVEEKFQFQSGYNSYFGLHHHYHVYREFLRITDLPLLAMVLGE